MIARPVPRHSERRFFMWMVRCLACLARRVPLEKLR